MRKSRGKRITRKFEFCNFPLSLIFANIFVIAIIIVIIAIVIVIIAIVIIIVIIAIVFIFARPENEKGRFRGLFSAFRETVEELAVLGSVTEWRVSQP